MKPKRGIRWQKSKEWPEVEWPENLYAAMILVYWKGNGVSVETIYKLGDNIILDAPLDTFKTDIPPYKQWSKFAIISWNIIE